jgi:hypothetical protein
MGEIHQLLLLKGANEARARAATRAERSAIDAAAAILSEEETRLGITHAGFAMTSLPHKRIAERYWRRRSPQITLYVESGLDLEERPIGVPYGSLARLILLYLQTEAIRTGSPDVELGRSMNRWLTRMGMSVGGRTYHLVAEQARRISACRLTFLSEPKPGIELRHNGGFVQNAISILGHSDERQPSLWQDHVRLDEGFWQSLREHPVPVREEAVKAIGTRSLAIDVYIWLAYRLHVLKKPVMVTWSAIHSQFGAGFAKVYHLRQPFLDALQLALAVYPEACVEVCDEGVTLCPSPPAVPHTMAKQLGIG